MKMEINIQQTQDNSMRVIISAQSGGYCTLMERHVAEMIEKILTEEVVPRVAMETSGTITYSGPLSKMPKQEIKEENQ
jgi:chromosome segregation and condensation protein ScpB